MPKSKVRRKPAYTPPPKAGPAPAGPSHPAYVVIMLGIGLIGLGWLVTTYLASESIEFIGDLGAYNFAIGFGLIVVSLLMTMKWR